MLPTKGPDNAAVRAQCVPNVGRVELAEAQRAGVAFVHVMRQRCPVLTNGGLQYRRGNLVVHFAGQKNKSDLMTQFNDPETGTARVPWGFS
eukprot:2318414-Rhodomonas_salina.1